MRASKRPLGAVPKTLGVLGLLLLALPFNLALTAVALLRSALVPPPSPAVAELLRQYGRQGAPGSGSA